MSSLHDKRVILLNPMAGSAERILELEAMLEGRPGWCILQTEREGHAMELARQAREQGARQIIAAGGDGTVHEVIHGMYDEENPTDALLGILPVGTGNDLARSLHLPYELLDLIELMESEQSRPLDLIEVTCGDKKRFAVNAANGGNAELTHDIVDDDVKQRWGALAYLIAAIRAVSDLQVYDVELTWPEQTTTHAQIFGMVVANGATLGGGMDVAPHASPSDGLLDVVIVKAIPKLQLARLGTRLLDPTFHITEDPALIFRRVECVRVVGEPPLWFNLDGEPFERGDSLFRVIPGALQVIAGVTPSAAAEAMF